MNIFLKHNLNLKPSKISKAQGFTLVEILVVLVIATIVLSIAIPRIRTVNKERNLREASRVLGSAISNASQRAAIDGVAGVRISRNPNFLVGSRQYAATEVSFLRKVPNYRGDALGATITNATAAAANEDAIQIPMPLEQTTLGIISAGDLISFGLSPTKYLIKEVFNNTAEGGTIGGSFGTMRLIVGLSGYLPAPAGGATFTVHRRPKILSSSTATLPDNYIIDLSYSGFELLDGIDTSGTFVPPYTAQTVLDRQLTNVFEPTPTDFYDDPTDPFGVVENYDIDIIFDEDGAVDFVLFTEVDHDNDGFADQDGDGTPNEVVFRRPLGPIYFFVTEVPKSLDTTSETATATENNFWVTVSNVSGSVNIGYNNPNQEEPLTGQFVTHKGTTLGTLSTYYFGPVDADFDLDDDRDEFNALIQAARTQAVSSGSTQ